ncbi:MAG: hypothetical protein OEQ53_11620, partial [Saprospiraceae bacterium]|nr:hypothetical protein [Saprospiraceae bacterium]
MSSSGRYQINTRNTILGILLMIVVLFVLFWVARTLFQLLALASPILLIIALIIDHRVVLNYGRWLWKMLRENTLMGVVATVLTVVGFPVVCFLLFGRALLNRKVRNMEQALENEKLGELTDYEIIEEEDTLELPSLDKEILPE